ncbi:MAG: T9SS type A sorting domain-containing protein [Candidatus Hatepunaea meridiana]|nr:T9SS type A sorting domain-containing protein [Candidatus Hatepunaea meridiana]
MKCSFTLILAVLLIAALPSLLIGQPEVEWQRSYGGVDRDVCKDLIQTSDGGYMLVGFDMSFGDVRQDAWAVKTDENGDSLWSREYGGDQGSYFSTVIQTEDGGYLFAGHSREFGNGELWLLKTDEDGEEDWSETYDGLVLRFRSIRQTEDGYFILGCRNVGEINQNGELQWSDEITGEAALYGTSIIETADGGYAMTGLTEYLDAQRYDGILVKINDEREVDWYQLHGGRQNDWLSDLVQTEDGGFAMIGATLSFDRNGLDGWLVRTDENGEFRDQSFFSTNSDDWLRHIMTTEDSGLILAGCTSSYALIYRTDGEGEELWNLRIGNNGDWDEGYSVIRSEDGGFALGGIYRRNHDDFLLVKLSPDPLLGAPAWQAIPDTSFNEDSFLELDIALLYNYIEDADNDNEDLEISIEDGEHLFVELQDEQFIITSDENWWGRDSLRLTVTDPDEHTASTYLSIRVNSINDPPGHFRLWYPENNSVVNSRRLVFVWEMANRNGYNEDMVCYTIRFSAGDQSYEVSGIEWVLDVWHLVSYSIPDIEGLLDELGIDDIGDGVEINWSVTAYDDSSSTECYEPFVFTVPSLWIENPDEQLIPLSFALHSAFPNPFNSVTTINYSINLKQRISLLIFNNSGSLITTLFNGNSAPGNYTAIWNASDMPAGIYFTRLAGSEGRIRINKLLLVK